MNEKAQPLLLLESPHVGDVGHAWVVSASGILAPEEVAVYRGNGPHRVIRATRSVIQRETGRRATETLLVAKAIPSQERDDETVRLVLREILEAEITPESLRRGEVTKDRADIFTAPCMERATRSFLADQRILGVNWTPLVHPPKARPGSRQLINWKNLILMIKILVLLIIFVSVIAGVAELSSDKSEKKEPTTAAQPQSVSFGDFEFLTLSSWKDFMGVTGGSEASEAIETQLNSSTKTPKSGRVSRRVVDNAPALSKNERDALEKVKTWWNNNIVDEFRQNRVETDDEIRGLSKIMMDEICSDGGAGSWYSNQKNHHDRLRKVGGDWLSKAQVLEEFRTKGLPNLDPEELGKRIGKLMGIVIELNASDDNAKNLSELIKKLKGSLARPEWLKIPSCKDAERLKKMKEILGHGEMGPALGMLKLETQETWEGIRENFGQLKVAPDGSKEERSKGDLKDFFGKKDSSK